MSDDDSIIGRTYGFGAEETAVIVEDQESVDSEQSEPILNPYQEPEPVQDPEPVTEPDPIPDPGSSKKTDSSISSKSTNGSISTKIMTKTTLTVGGISIDYDPGVTQTSDTEAFYKKAERANLTADKLADLFEKATRSKLTVKFDIVSSTFSDEDKLDDTYNLGILINRFKNHLQKYDMLDVMSIVHVDKVDTSKPTGIIEDLLTDYSKIPDSVVASSCAWYRQYTTDPWYRENLQLITDFLENNTTEGLWEKCIEAHDEYPAESRGGPLIFSIMMKLLQSHSDNAVQYLINSVKNLRIRDFEGENVSKVVSLVRGAYKRLKSITKLPEEFPQWVLQLLQTSSVDEFNEAFTHLQRDIEVIQTLLNNTTVPTYPSIENMLGIAQRKYLELVSTNKWSGLNTKANQSAFFGQKVDGAKKMTCWNCGAEGHSIKTCTKALNQTAIEQRKKAFNDAKGGGHGKKPEGKKEGSRTPKKWSPPTSEEKNRRVINGKPMFYVRSTQRWEPDKKAAGGSPAGHVAAPTPTSTPPTTSGEFKASRDLAFSNASHTINVAMQGFLNAMQES